MLIKVKKNLPPIFVLFILLYPKSMDYIPFFSPLVKIIYIAQVLFVVFILLKYIIKFIYSGKISKTVVCFSLILITFNMSYFISDAYTGVLDQTFTVNMRRMLVCISLFLYMELSNMQTKEGIIKSAYYFLTALMVLNIIVYLLFPSGIAHMSMYSNEGYLTWTDSIGFLDADNRVSLYAFLYFYIAQIYYASINRTINNKFVYNFMIYIITITNIVLSRSASGILSLLVLVSFMILINYKKSLSRIISWKGLLVLSLFVGLFVSGKFSGLLSFLGTIFNKGYTLSGRTEIWLLAIEKIAKSYILGYGTLDGGAFFHIGTYTWYAHNQYLDLWLQGGILCLIMFFVLIIYTNKKIRSVQINKSYFCFVAVLLAFLTLGIVEHFIIRNYYQFWLFICIAFSMRNYKICDLLELENLNQRHKTIDKL